MIADGFSEVRHEMTEGFAAVRKTIDEHTSLLQEHSETLSDHTNRLTRIEQKLDNTIVRVDDQGVRIERLEKAQELR